VNGQQLHYDLSNKAERQFLFASKNFKFLALWATFAVGFRHRRKESWTKKILVKNVTDVSTI